MGQDRCRARAATNRRRLLAAVGSAIAASGGCLGRGAIPGGGEPSPTPATPVTGADGEPADICERPADPTAIPAVTEPQFGPDWDGATVAEKYTGALEGLEDPMPVVGIEREGDARAYPVTVLARHEIVNDAFDVPVLVSFCPLCSSGLVAKRRVAGRETVFTGSGLVWVPPSVAGRESIESDGVFGIPDSYPAGPESATPRVAQNLVMVDRATGSYWSQLLARAICGPRTGETLALLPSTVTTWGEWRADHPDTAVLLPPPHSGLVA